MVAASLGELREGMRQLIAAGAREITLDLTDVQMLDSRGIGLLIAAHNSLRQKGGRLAVVHASPEILELLRTMRIHQHFSVSGS
jgi:anti-anti-sigma factor